MVSARALHFVLKIGNRGANMDFFRTILGMKVNSSYCKNFGEFVYGGFYRVILFI